MNKTPSLNTGTSFGVYADVLPYRTDKVAMCTEARSAQGCDLLQPGRRNGTAHSARFIRGGSASITCLKFSLENFQLTKQCCRTGNKTMKRDGCFTPQVCFCPRVPCRAVGEGGCRSQFVVRALLLCWSVRAHGSSSADTLPPPDSSRCASLSVSGLGGSRRAAAGVRGCCTPSPLPGREVGSLLASRRPLQHRRALIYRLVLPVGQLLRQAVCAAARRDSRDASARRRSSQETRDAGANHRRYRFSLGWILGCRRSRHLSFSPRGQKARGARTIATKAVALLGEYASTVRSEGTAAASDRRSIRPATAACRSSG